MAVDLSTAREALEALGALAAAAPGVEPVKASPEEPVRTAYSPAVVEDAWDDDRFLMWRARRQAGVFGTLDGGGRGAPARVTVTANADRVDAKHLLEALRALVTRYGAQFGFVHQLTEADRDRFGPGDSYDDPNDPEVILVEDDMRRWLPQLFWATAIGPPFSDLLGADRLRTAPAAIVDELGPGTFLLVLSEDPEGADEMRARVQSHLGEDAFWDPRKGTSGPYRSVGTVPRPRPAAPADADPADVVAQLVRDLSDAVMTVLTEEREPYPVGLLRRNDGTTDVVVIGDESDPEAAAARLDEVLSEMRTDPGVVAVGAAVAEEAFVDFRVAHRAAPPVHLRRSLRRVGSQVELGPPTGMA